MNWTPVLVALVACVASLGLYAARRALAANAIYQLSYEYRHRKNIVQVFFSKRSSTTMRTSMTRPGSLSQVPMYERRRIMPNLAVDILYTNWRGVMRQRPIVPTGHAEFRKDQWHPEEQWMIEALDKEDGVTKWWPLANIHEWIRP